jgi:DNA-binding NtrC family response regulator
MNAKTQILVVDDEEVVRRSLYRALDDGRTHVELAGDGTVALNAMGRQPFDVVLLDLRMPHMDGVEVLEAIKRQWPHTEVIVITGYPELETAKRAMRLGAYDFLAKPVGPDEIVEAADGAARHKRWALRCEA